MFTQRFEIGQTVKLRRDVDGLLGRRARCGSRGTVVSRIGGWSDHYEVRLSSGVVRVSARNLRPASATAGDLISGAKIALALFFGVPAAISLFHFFVFHHGTVTELIAAVPGTVASQIVVLIGMMSPPILILLGALLLIRHRHRHRRK